MIHLFVVALLFALSAADQDAARDAAGPVVQVYKLDEMHRDLGHHHYRGHHQKEKYLQHEHQHAYRDGYQHHNKPINVNLNHANRDGRHGHGMSQIERIVSEVHNPDYVEPIRLLDYRYLKSGGRDYARSDGGQVLILPKNVRVNQNKEFANYDELIEFLRLKQIAELEAMRMEIGKLGYEQKHNDYYQHRIEIGSHPQLPSQYRDAYQGHGHQQSIHRPQERYTELYKRDAEPVNETVDKTEGNLAEKSVEETPQKTA